MSTERAAYTQANRGYGLYAKTLRPLEEFSTPSLEFFERIREEFKGREILYLDAGAGNGLRFLDGVRYLAEEGNIRIKYLGTDIQIEPLYLLLDTARNFSIDYFFPMANVSDLRRPWCYPDNTFDVVQASWVLHWMGRDHLTTIAEMIRVLREGGIGFISTVTPFDNLIKDELFPAERLSLDAIREIFDEYDEIRLIKSRITGKLFWRVRFTSMIEERLKTNPNFVLVEKHAESIIGKKEVVGFNPNYLINRLEQLGCKVIYTRSLRNKFSPNEFKEPQKACSILYYVFQKK